MTVHLVGAGPGDPGLLTVRGAELLGRAEVVVHDRLTAAALLDLVPEGCEVIDVGKDPSGTSVPQEHINALLVERGLSGATVVRLKGGDPYVFARGAEEAAALAAQEEELMLASAAAMSARATEEERTRTFAAIEHEIEATEKIQAAVIQQFVQKENAGAWT